LGLLAHNTLDDLVTDMERLRLKLGIPVWAICGGSWGALIALRYAISYPNRISGLMFRSPFLGTQAEIEAFFNRMLHWLGADACSALGLSEHAHATELLQKITKLLMGDDAGAEGAAAIWEAFEADIAKPSYESSSIASHYVKWVERAPEKSRLANAAAVTKFRLQAHYLSNGCFLEPNWHVRLAQGFNTLTHLPVELVHGDQDWVCPQGASEILREIFPHSRFSIVRGAGHEMNAPAMHQALRQAATSLIERIGS
jgi:proline iminopeptidase